MRRQTFLAGLLAGAFACLSACAAAADRNDYRLAVDPRDYRLRLAPDGSAAPEPPPAPRKPAPLGGLVERHAQARGLDPALVHAVIRAESAYRPDAVSPKGAVGLMQVMPDTGRRFGVQEARLFHPEENLKAGTAYLRYLLGLFDDLALALAAYNAGENAVIRHGNAIPPYPETRAYVKGILKEYRGEEAVPPPAPPGVKLARDVDLSAFRLRTAAVRESWNRGVRP